MAELLIDSIGREDEAAAILRAVGLEVTAHSESANVFTVPDDAMPQIVELLDENDIEYQWLGEEDEEDGEGDEEEEDEEDED